MIDQPGRMDPLEATDRTDASATGETVERPSVLALLLVLGCSQPRLGGRRFDFEDAERIEIGRGPRLGLSRDGQLARLEVPDPKMSSRHAVVGRDDGSLHVTDLASTNGTYVDGARHENGPVAAGALLRIGHTFFRLRRLRPAPPTAALGVPSLHPDLAWSLDRLARLARSEVSLLLHGETGTGKEVIARAVHTASRRAGALVPVNCGALPQGLVEAQLFGHVRGAFSGAVRDEPGLVRASAGGTLFLDEVGELPLAAQATLLRVLQEREVVPVGGSRVEKVDLRVIAATHQPLQQRVTQGRFREDLYARLAGFVFTVPALRDRIDDVGLLVRALLEREGARGEPRLRPEMGRALLRHRWPQNVRELDQALRVSAALSTDGRLRLEDLPPAIRDATPVSALSPADAALRAEVVVALRAENGNVSAAARAMGKARQQLQRWIRRFEIGDDEMRP